MQTTKILLAIGTAALLAIPLPSFAGPDTEAQARMREALRQKMAELNAAPASAIAPVAPPPVTVPAKPEPSPSPTPIAIPQPTIQTPTVVVPVPVDSSDEATAAQLREALRQKMEAVDTQSIPPAVPVQMPAPETQIAPPQPIVSQTPAPPIKAPQSDSFSSVAVSSDDAKAAKLRAALRQSMATTLQPDPTPLTTIPAKPTAKGVAPIFNPAPTANLQAPASPLTGSKQDRLAELLRRYKMDVITPMEYHTQRAKIIAEP